MIFSINQNEFVSALQHIVGVIERKQTMAILSNILINVKADFIELTGTDLEIQIVSRFPAKIERTGTTTVPARKLLDICRLLPDTSIIKVETVEQKLHLNSGKSRFKLSTLNAEGYPEFTSIENEHEIALDSKCLKNLLKKTSFCMANQDVRYFLNGLLLQISGSKINAVASDGHRLSLYRGILDKPAYEDITIIVPRKGVLELNRIVDSLDETINIKISSNTIEAACNNILFSSKLIDGKFPDFKNVFDQDIQQKFELDTKEIKDTITRVSILSNETLRSIMLKFDENLLKISANNSEQEEAYEEMDIVYQGDILEVAFNASYLLDAINNIDSEKLILSFTTKTNICLIEDTNDENLTFVIMPMRL